MKTFLLLGIIVMLGAQVEASEKSPKDSRRVQREHKKFDKQKKHFTQSGMSPAQARIAIKNLRKSKKYSSSDEETN